MTADSSPMASIGKRKAAVEAPIADDSSNKRPKIDETNGVQAIFDWASSHGARLNKLQLREDGEKVQSIPSNAEMCYIPESLVLSETKALASEFGRQFTTYLKQNPSDSAGLSQGGRDPYAPGLIMLSGYLVYERFVKARQSFWAPYLYNLPEQYTLPIWWEVEELEVGLAGTQLLHVVRERKKLLERGLALLERACGNLFQDGSLIWSNLLWAYSAISSRAFPRSRTATPITDERFEIGQETVEAAGEASELCMYPALDLINHRRGERVEWQIKESGENAGVAFIALDDVQNAVEIFNNYGAKGNENLLGNYGFVLDPNPEDYVKVSMQLRDDIDPCAARKRSLLQKCSSRLIHLLFADDDLPEELLALTRMLVMKSYELDRFEKTFGTSVIAPQTPINACNELRTLSTLHTLLAVKLEGLTNSQPPDDWTNDAERRRLVSVYRRGQETILRHHITNIMRAMKSFILQIARQKWDPRHIDDAPKEFGIEALDCVFWSSENRHFDWWCKERVEKVDEEYAEDFDQDTLLALGLVREREKGEGSKWGRFLVGRRGVGLTFEEDQFEDVKEVLGDSFEDAKEHFEEFVRPALDSAPAKYRLSKETYNWENFAWAVALLEENGLDLPAELFEHVPHKTVFGVLMA